MTKIDIFSGFLGAGKTTLIKKLIIGGGSVLYQTCLRFRTFAAVCGRGYTEGYGSFQCAHLFR